MAGNFANFSYAEAKPRRIMTVRYWRNKLELRLLNNLIAFVWRKMCCPILGEYFYFLIFMRTNHFCRAVRAYDSVVFVGQLWLPVELGANHWHLKAITFTSHLPPPPHTPTPTLSLPLFLCVYFSVFVIVSLSISRSPCLSLSLSLPLSCDLSCVAVQTSGFVGLGINAFPGLCVHYSGAPCFVC